MTAFRVLAIDAAGKREWHLLDASSQDVCIAQLSAQGWTPVTIASGPMSLVERLNQPIGPSRRLGITEQTMLMAQLATLVQAGMPVDRSLDLIRDSSIRVKTQQMLLRILDDVRGGNSLGRALERENVLPVWAIGVIRSAELGGKLGTALAAVAERLRRSNEARQRLVTALTYPAAVLIATLVAMVIVLTTVVPQFEPLFRGSESKLPLLTVLVLDLSRLVQDRGLIIAGGALVLCGLIWLGLHSQISMATRVQISRLVPGMALRDQIIAAGFVGLLGTLTQNGVTIVKALPLARRTVSSQRWQQAISIVERQVREGERLSVALKAQPVFPITATRLIEVGERTGSFAQTCLSAAEIMNQSASARIERIVSLANPIATIMLGGIIALMVAGVMLGIFALGDFAG